MKIEIIPNNKVSIRLPGHKTPPLTLVVRDTWQGFTRLETDGGQSGEIIIHEVQKATPNFYDLIPQWLGGNNKPAVVPMAMAEAVIVRASTWIRDLLVKSALIDNDDTEDKKTK